MVRNGTDSDLTEEAEAREWASLLERLRATEAERDQLKKDLIPARVQANLYAEKFQKSEAGYRRVRQERDEARAERDQAIDKLQALERWAPGFAVERGFVGGPEGVAPDRPDDVWEAIRRLRARMNRIESRLKFLS